MAEIAYLTAQPRQPALFRRDARVRFPAAAGRRADPGAAAEVPAELHGRAAALHRAAARRFRSCSGCCCRRRRSRCWLSVALYTAVQLDSDWNLPAYPTGVWFFNPLAWQLIFVVGAWCGRRRRSTRLGPFVRSRWRARAWRSRFSLLAFLIVMTWYFPRYAVLIPKWVQDWMYPIDKNNMDVLRFAALHRAGASLPCVSFRSTGRG